MLLSLHIRNFAIIEDVTLEFGPGLNVLSGETGAGKSIIIQALGLLTGERGSADWIRKGEDSAVVTGHFDIQGQTDLIQLLEEQAVPLDADELLIQRTLSRTGRNQVRLNGMPATVQLLSQLSEGLVDIVSQSEHEMWLKADRQRDVLDRFGQLEKTRESYRQHLAQLQDLQVQQDELATQDSSSREMEEFLRFQLTEIEDAKLKEGEDQELLSCKGRVKHAAQLGELCQFVEEAIGSGEGAVLDRLHHLETRLGKAVTLDPQLEKFIGLVGSARVEMEEVVNSLADYMATLQFEPRELESVEQRLAEMDRLKRKYGASIAEILACGERVREKLSGLENFDERMDELGRAITESGKLLEKTDGSLQKVRRKVGQDLSRQVTQELADLGMEMAKFSVHWDAVTAGVLQYDTKSYDRFGSSRAVFYLAPNPGEDAKPLGRIASGGERSRILLALHKVLVDFAGRGTSVYDEVDEGVGGATASRIGEKLLEIGRKRQVICISHQAQIVACGTQHFAITKDVKDGRAQTTVRSLNADEREQELARMLGGKTVTRQAREHARALLREGTS